MNRIQERAAETSILRRQAIESKKCYSCPEGYLDSLADDILSRINQESDATLDVAPQSSWWLRLRPSLYLAASFVTILLALQGIKMIQDTETHTTAQQGQDYKEEEYTKYYEDYASRLVGNEEEHNLDKALCL